RPDVPRGRQLSRRARRPRPPRPPPRSAAKSRRDRRERLPHPSLRRYQGADSSPVRIRRRQLVHKFFEDRGTHLAAMVAYFALLSFVPLVFLALSLFGLAHRAKASDFFVKELENAFPGTSVESITTLLHRVQNNAAA